MTLLPDGRLIHLMTVADTAATSLADVSALVAAQVNGQTSLFAASSTEPGISQFRLSLGTPGLTIVNSANVINGGASDDLLLAGSTTTAV